MDGRHDPHDGGACDQESDGKPGATLLAYNVPAVNLDMIYATLRTEFSLDGQVFSSDKVQGQIDATIEQGIPAKPYDNRPEWQTGMNELKLAPPTTTVAGKTTIPAVVRDDVRDRLELALVENLQRTDLNAIETARAYKLLMETYDLTQEQVAERVGKSRSQVANMLRTLTAPQPLQDAVMEGKISEGHLRALLPLPLSEALSALGQIIAKELSVRDAEALVRKMVHPSRRSGRARARVMRGDPDLAQVTNELRAALGTKVEILRRRRGGRILVDFYSDEDFERLYELFIRAGKA